ncbi:hypothetical protein [Halomarina ordinaria]|uniref:DUF2238 domain-containing protein n=1 Tax=Halomarina ordinaria TaxID=3033939 RepID=A0ABD5U7R0_9EURY|nr:hypothetical protein [Halomarina sp. PSRA2]
MSSVLSILDSSARRTVAALARRGRHLLRAGISTVLVEGVRRRNPSVVVNGLVSLALTFAPTLLERRYGTSFHPWQRLWVSGAMFLHALGMLGSYDRVWWWDHVTHTLSASIVGSLAYVFARTSVDGDGERRVRNTSGFVVGVTLGLGVLWEVFEYIVHALARRLGLEPLLVPYGPYDTAFDLVFDAVGAALVVAFGPRALSNVVDSLDARRGDGGEPHAHASPE